MVAKPDIYDFDRLADFFASLPSFSRPVIQRYFREPVTIHQKSDNSPVTRADRETETALRNVIKAGFPDHAIFGEEFGADDDILTRPTWVIDPIDGTRAFIAGKPTFGTIIGFCASGEPVAGLIDMPCLDEAYIGVLGPDGKAQASLNGTPISVSSVTTLADAQIATTSPYAFHGDGWARFEAVGQRCRNVIFGGDCHNYALLASGHLDIVIEHGLQPYDLMGLIPVLKAAGAVVSDWQGQPITLDNRGEILTAATPELHAAALDILHSKSSASGGLSS